MAEIKTRIALKYDSYENWAANSTLVLLKGELGICEIPAETSEVAETTTGATSKVTTAPTVLFKVGDGKTQFSALPWASAKAADVYSWAKKSEEEFKTWLSTAAGFATDDEVANAIAGLKATLEAKDAGFESRIATLEANLGIDDGSEGSVQGQLTALDSRLDVLEGEGEGSVTKALADAKAYADAQDTIAKQAAIDTAKSYTDGEVEKIEANLADINKAISEESTARITAIDDINGRIGTGFSSENTVAKAIQDAVDAAEAAATAAETLKTTEVAANAQAILDEETARKAEDAKVNALISAMDAAYKEADTELSGRLDSVEAWQDTIKNVMDFVGVSTTDPTSEDAVTIEGLTEFQKGDVVLYEGKEFVNITGTNEKGAWEEFGVGTATDAAIAALENRVTENEKDIKALEEKDTTIEASLAQKAAKADFEAFQTTVGNTYETIANADLIRDRLDTIETADEQRDETIAAKLDTATYNEFKTGYDAKIEALEAADAGFTSTIETIQENLNDYALATDLDATDKTVGEQGTAIENLTGRVEALEGTYTNTEVDEKISEAVTAVKTPLEAADAAFDARLDKYDTYFGTDAEGNLPEVLVFNCGGATAETLNAIN